METLRVQEQEYNEHRTKLEELEGQITQLVSRMQTIETKNSKHKWVTLFKLGCGGGAAVCWGGESCAGCKEVTWLLCPVNQDGDIRANVQGADHGDQD